MTVFHLEWKFSKRHIFRIIHYARNIWKWFHVSFGVAECLFDEIKSYFTKDGSQRGTFSCIYNILWCTVWGKWSNILDTLWLIFEIEKLINFPRWSLQEKKFLIFIISPMTWCLGNTVGLTDGCLACPYRYMCTAIWAAVFVVGFESLTAATAKIAVFWNETPCNPTDVHISLCFIVSEERTDSIFKVEE
jgi:hypothetical protein